MAASPTRSKVNIDWIESEVFEKKIRRPIWSTSTASWCPAASASAARKARSTPPASRGERKVPYFGICFGMQMAVIEAARNLAGIARTRSSTEFGPTPEPVVGLMTEWLRGNMLEKRRRGGRSRRHDAARRLSRRALEPARKIACDLRRRPQISERHRHRYEVNIDYQGPPRGLHGMRFAGMSPDGLLPETIEYRRSSLVHRRAVPSRAEVAAASSRTRCSPRFIGGGDGAEPAGVERFEAPPAGRRSAISPAIGDKACPPKRSSIHGTSSGARAPGSVNERPARCAGAGHDATAIAAEAAICCGVGRPPWLAGTDRVVRCPSR